MRRVVPLLIVLNLGFAPAPVYREKPDTSKGDLQKMQGKWAVVRQTTNGEGYTLEANYTVEIAGNHFRHFFSGKMISESSIKLDATKRIKEIDRETVSGELMGGAILQLGIYRFDGDCLHIAYIYGGKLRPSDFDAKGRGEATCIFSVLKRIKP